MLAVLRLLLLLLFLVLTYLKEQGGLFAWGEGQSGASLIWFDIHIEA